MADSPKMIYYFLSVPINVDHKYANEYIYHFFKWIALNFCSVPSVGNNFQLSLVAKNGLMNTDFQLQYSFFLRYRRLSGSPPVSCAVHHYARSVYLGNEGNDATTYSKSGGFADDYTVKIGSYNTSTTVFISTTDGTSSNIITLPQNSGSSSLTLYYRQSADYYEEIYLSDFVMGHYIRGLGCRYYLKNSLRKRWDAEVTETSDINTTGLAPIIIPIARGALANMGWVDQSGLIQLCHNVIISNYQQQTVKVGGFFGGGFFGFLLVIVIVVVITYCTYGTGTAAAGGAAGGAASAGASASAGAAAAAGASSAAFAATISSLAITIAKGIAIAVMAKILSKSIAKVVGGELGEILGTAIATIASIYAAYATAGWGASASTVTTTANTNSALYNICTDYNTYLKIANSVFDFGMKKLNQKYQGQYYSLTSDYNQLQERMKSGYAQMNYFNYQQGLWNDSKFVTDIIVNNSYANTYQAATSSTYPVMAERPETFFTRTLDMDFYDMNAAYINDFYEMHLNLGLD